MSDPLYCSHNTELLRRHDIEIEIEVETDMGMEETNESMVRVQANKRSR